MTLKPGARCARDLKPTETRTTPRGTIMFDHETSAIELAQNLQHDGFDGAWTATADKAGLSSRYAFDADTDVQPFTASQLAAEVHHLKGGGGANQKS